MVICAISHKPKTTPTINSRLKPKNNHKSASSYRSRKVQIFLLHHFRNFTIRPNSQQKACHSRYQKPDRLVVWSFSRLGNSSPWGRLRGDELCSGWSLEWGRVVWSWAGLASPPLGRSRSGVVSFAWASTTGRTIPFFPAGCNNVKPTTFPQSGHLYLVRPYFCTLIRNTRPHS